MPSLSPRLRAVVDALPLTEGMRVLEVGCGPGAAAREIARRVGSGHVLAIDRSPTAIAQAVTGSSAQIATGRLEYRCVAVEDLVLDPGVQPFDLAVAVRVGALDGRHPGLYVRAVDRIRAALRPGGELLVDGGSPLRRIDVWP